MKTILIIFSVLLFSNNTISQTKYTIPAPSDLQKYQAAALQLNGTHLMQIGFAKSHRIKVDQAAKFFGDQLGSTWNTAGGFDGLVQGILYMMVTLVPYGSVEILSQDGNSVEYVVTGFFPELREGGSVYDVTYPEYLRYWDIALSWLSDKFGAQYNQKDTDEGLKVTISRKPPP